ncbi:hypothetical protein [Acidisoma sp. 7E03]
MEHCDAGHAHGEPLDTWHQRRVIYSFVLDTEPRFAAHGWLLAQSLMRCCGARAADIHVQATPDVAPPLLALFRDAGFAVLHIARFGDGRWCNKIAQLPNLFDVPSRHIVLLDTDMIAVGDIRPFLRDDGIQAKVVDMPNPSLGVLHAILAEAGCQDPPLTATDALGKPTVLGNANGGFYAVPRPLARRFDAAWRHWALWLQDHGAPLAEEGRTQHVDQVSAALAFRVSGIPFIPAPSNLNYFTHFQAPHGADDDSAPICLLHHHGRGLSPDGQFAPPFPLTEREQAAVAIARGLVNDHLAPLLPELASRLGLSEVAVV